VIFDNCVSMLGAMMTLFVPIINSYPPGGWGTAPPPGGRLVINRQKRGGKGINFEPGEVTAPSR
jgi:hypothetical protein